jgi:hypothetical protein
MSTLVISIDINATFADAFQAFSHAKIHGAPVMDGDIIMGIVTLTDIAGGIAQGRTLDSPITDVMTKNVVTSSPNIKLYDVIGRFKEENIGRLVIMKDGKPAGILTQSDIIHVFPAL